MTGIENHGRPEDGAGPGSLPRGRHGLPRELVEENQRARLISAMIEAVAEHGYGATTIAHITAGAKISRRTYYENFANKVECFSAAYEKCFAYLMEAMRVAMGDEREWPGRVRAGLGALLADLAASPDLASFFLIAPAAVDDANAERHHLAMGEIASALIAGAPDSGDSAEPPVSRVDAIAGGLSALIARKVSGGEAEELPLLLPSLVELVLQPFVGSEEAVRVARD